MYVNEESGEARQIEQSISCSNVSALPCRTAVQASRSSRVDEGKEHAGQISAITRGSLYASRDQGRDDRARRVSTLTKGTLRSHRVHDRFPVELGNDFTVSFSFAPLHSLPPHTSSHAAHLHIHKPPRCRQCGFQIPRVRRAKLQASVVPFKNPR
jgi:hypothetical protein